MDMSHFSAADALIGYLYQFRVALLGSLRKLKAGTDFAVSIETADDVTFESGGSATEVLQTKYRVNRPANLTDASPDIWKTLRVWIEGRKAGTIHATTQLYLLTTATAPPGSAAANLRLSGRNVEAALVRLTAAAQISDSSENRSGCELYLAAGESERRALLNSVVVCDNEQTITELGRDIADEIVFACPRAHQEAFLERLEGWWFRRVLRQLVNVRAGERILGGDLELQMGDLREQFTQDSLPIDEDVASITREEALAATQGDAMFVRQLELVRAGQRRIRIAIWNYHRAFVQRSRWLREDLSNLDELGKYERRLVEEWETYFEARLDELGAEAAEEEKVRVARMILEWAEGANYPVRRLVTEAFVTRGSLQMLADRLKVGWHPEFRDRLASILAGDAGASA